MIGGNTTRSMNSGAISTVGRPGTSARTTPVTISRIGDGIFDRAATRATPATTANRNTSVWIVGIISFPSLPPCGGRWPEGPDEGLAPSRAGFERLREMFAEFNLYRVVARKRHAARPLIRLHRAFGRTPVFSTGYAATFSRKGRRGFPTREIFRLGDAQKLLNQNRRRHAVPGSSPRTRMAACFSNMPGSRASAPGQLAADRLSQPPEDQDSLAAGKNAGNFLNSAVFCEICLENICEFSCLRMNSLRIQGREFFCQRRELILRTGNRREFGAKPIRSPRRFR